MKPKKEHKSRSSGMVKEPTTKYSHTRISSKLPSENAAMDDEKEFQDMMAIVMDLQRQLKHSRELNLVLHDDIEDVRATRLEIEALAASRAKEIDSFQEEISSFQTENESLIMELDASEDERGEAVKEINRLKKDIEDRQQDIEFLEGKQSDLENALEKSERESEAREQDLQEKVQQLEQDKNDLENRLKQKNNKLHEANALMESLNQEKRYLESRVSYLERARKNLTKIRDSLKGIQDQVLNDEPIHGEVENKVKTLKKDVEDKQKIIDSFEQKIFVLNNNIKEAEQDDGEVQTLGRNMKELENTLKQKTDALHQAEVLIYDMNREIQRMEKAFLDHSRSSKNKDSTKSAR